MSETRAVPLALLESANRTLPFALPLCPRCLNGYLQPFHVTIGLRGGGSAGFEGADFLEGWVAICHGNQPFREAVAAMTREATGQDDDLPEIEVSPACGFTMPMTAGRLHT